MEAPTSLFIFADGNITDWFGGLLYSAGQQANEAVLDQLSALSFTSLAIIFGRSGAEIVGDSLAFALGLATTLALLEIAASFAGKAYDQIGPGLPLAASCLAIVMDFNLLEIIEIQLPSFFFNSFDPVLPQLIFLQVCRHIWLGLHFLALAASPYSTPVLATLLGYVATSRDPVVGGSLLLAYTNGHVTPLLLAASFAGALQSLLSFRKFSAWINPMRTQTINQLNPKTRNKKETKRKAEQKGSTGKVRGVVFAAAHRRSAIIIYKSSSRKHCEAPFTPCYFNFMAE